MAFTADGEPVASESDAFYFPWSGTDVSRREISCILPGQLYLTNCRGVEDLSALQELGITHVLCINEQENLFPDKLVYYNVSDVTDDPEMAEALKAKFTDAFDFIDAASAAGRCVVHCAAGISRSSTLVLGYLIARKGMTLRQAFVHTICRRRVIWPNDGFWERLVELEREALHLEAPSLPLPLYQQWAEMTEEDHRKAATTLDRGP
ncbi:mpl3 [Symbiodinium natans]|uniref:protein-tyrosine-phosphatase n=1 Tax=Symbiodinium natans TaxID=878477 RepID=A0A812LXA5_9DINO|nr:mpl3 [Symbiodinium natans]